MKHHSKNFRNVPYPFKFWAYTLLQATFLLNINILSRKSRFVGSCIFFFISAMGIVSFFVSWRCISGSGKHSVMNQGKRLRLQEVRKDESKLVLLVKCVYTHIILMACVFGSLTWSTHTFEFFLKCSVKHMVFVTNILNCLLFKKNKKLNVNERKQLYLILLTPCFP